MSRVLCIGDLHLPSTHPGYLDFVRDVRERWRTDTVIFMGDIVDLHAVSFYAAHPEMPGPADEAKMAADEVAKWTKHFPKATTLIGNHCARVLRKAESEDIPRGFLRDHKEVWNTPHWDWVWETSTDGVYYTHGWGAGGQHPSYNLARQMCQSVAIGHVHTAGGVKWLVGPTQRLFGLDVGCGVDDDSLAFAYAKHVKMKSVISCAVVLDGTPFHVIAPVGPGERFHKSRYRKEMS